MEKRLVILLAVVLVIYGCAQEPVESTTLTVPAPDVSDPFEVEEMVVNEEPSIIEQFDEERKKEQPEENPEKKGCIGTGPVEFTSPPMPVDDVGIISPMGQMIGGHVTPIDHGYYSAVNWKPEDYGNPDKFKDVLSPADGVITSIGAMPGSNYDDYRIVIHHTCTFFTVYIHVKELTQNIKDVTGEVAGHVYPGIPVKAGEVFARAGGFDFSVHDEDIFLPGFIVPEHYEGESWKIHTVDMFDSFVEPIKTGLLEKNVRTVLPYGGRIDYDIVGRLVGNWFEDGSGDYGGNKNPENYWVGHLSFAYDGIEPSLLIVSMGDYDGEAVQFAVKGNSPDPADVSVEDGLVKYELVNYQYITEDGAEWDQFHYILFFQDLLLVVPSSFLHQAAL